jgi:hypothetical protein
MIDIKNIQPGDRVSVRAHGKSVTRPVYEVGRDYVVVQICGAIQKIPVHWITSHTRREWT